MLFTLLFHFLLYCEIEVLLLVICTLQKGTVLFRDVNLPRAAWLVFANSRVRYDEEPWKDAINWHSFCQVTKPGTSVCASPTPPCPFYPTVYCSWAVLCGLTSPVASCQAWHWLPPSEDSLLLGELVILGRTFTESLCEAALLGSLWQLVFMIISHSCTLGWW